MTSLRTNNLQQQSVYCATTGNAALRGGGYLVIGPRSQTSFGSLTHNQFTNNPFPNIFDINLMGDPDNRPILSPSYQRIDLVSNTVRTYLLNNRLANETWVNNNIKAPQSLICTTLAPDDTAVPPASDWATPFPDGIGINISLPTPIHGPTHPIHTRPTDKNVWTDINRPLYRLNGNDLNSNRTDGTPGLETRKHRPTATWIRLRLQSMATSLTNPSIKGIHTSVQRAVIVLERMRMSVSPIFNDWQTQTLGMTRLATRTSL